MVINLYNLTKNLQPIHHSSLMIYLTTSKNKNYTKCTMSIKISSTPYPPRNRNTKNLKRRESTKLKQKEKIHYSEKSKWKKPEGREKQQITLPFTKKKLLQVLSPSTTSTNKPLGIFFNTSKRLP